MCSVAPNLPTASSCRPEHSPAHKVSWEGTERRDEGLERGREEREEEWGQRAFELERIQRDSSPQGKLPRRACTRPHTHTRKDTNTFVVILWTCITISIVIITIIILFLIIIIIIITNSFSL